MRAAYEKQIINESGPTLGYSVETLTHFIVTPDILAVHHECIARKQSQLQFDLCVGAQALAVLNTIVMT